MRIASLAPGTGRSRLVARAFETSSQGPKDALLGPILDGVRRRTARGWRYRTQVSLAYSDVMSAVMEGRLSDLAGWKPVHCSIAKTLEVVGTRSAILILREAYYGNRRFDLLAARIGITDAALSPALRKLVGAGLLEKNPYREPGQRSRHEYVLTTKGADLLPVLLAMMQWGDKYCQDGAPPLELRENSSDEPVFVQVRSASGHDVPLDNVRVRVSKEWRRRFGAATD